MRWKNCEWRLQNDVSKDFGVFIHWTFKPSLQCKEAYARTRVTFFMMRQGLTILRPAIFRPLCLAMVRPHLDYPVRALFPYVKSLRRLPYPERLHEHSACYSHHGVHAVPRLPELVCGGVLRSATLRYVNHVCILLDGKRLLLYVRPDLGIDCLHTSLKPRV